MTKLPFPRLAQLPLEWPDSIVGLYRELKEELGLDHYEGRHWLGWHHHVTLVSMAFAFLRSEQVQAKKTSGAMLLTLPQMRARLQVRLIHLAGQCPWCKTRFDNTA